MRLKSVSRSCSDAFIINISRIIVGLPWPLGILVMKKRLQDECGPPMALACVVRVPFDEERTEWSPGAFLRNHPWHPRWVTRGQVRARARVVRFLVKFLSPLNEDLQAIVVSFFWEPYRNPWDSLLA